MSRLANRRGFTLLEVLVATTIMGIAVVSVLSALSTTMRSAAKLTDYDRAVMLSRSKIDELLLDPHFPLDTVVEEHFDPALMGGLQGGWRAQLKRFDTPPSPIPGDHVLDRMEMEIWWVANGQRRTFRLDGYKEETLRPEAQPQ